MNEKNYTVEEVNSMYADTDGIFYIENTVGECRSKITAYFKTYEEALEGIKSCSDWFREEGTGRIYFMECGLGKKGVLLYSKL